MILLSNPERWAEVRAVPVTELVANHGTPGHVLGFLDGTVLAQQSARVDERGNWMTPPPVPHTQAFVIMARTVDEALDRARSERVSFENRALAAEERVRVVERALAAMTTRFEEAAKK